MDTTPSRPLAVVTGASSGIGLELARQFADHGYDLIVAAEDAAVAQAAAGLQTAAEAVRVDLATAEGVERLYARICADGRPVDAIALNAGIGAGGAFAIDTELETELRLIDLNVRMNGDERVVSASLSTKLQGRGSRFIPDSAKAAMHRRMAEPGSAKQ